MGTFVSMSMEDTRKVIKTLSVARRPSPSTPLFTPFFLFVQLSSKSAKVGRGNLHCPLQLIFALYRPPKTLKARIENALPFLWSVDYTVATTLPWYFWGMDRSSQVKLDLILRARGACRRKRPPRLGCGAGRAISWRALASEAIHLSAHPI